MVEDGSVLRAENVVSAINLSLSLRRQFLGPRVSVEIAGGSMSRGLPVGDGEGIDQGTGIESVRRYESPLWASTCTSVAGSQLSFTPKIPPLFIPSCRTH